MERKFVVELQSPLFEPHLSRVASEVASRLTLSEGKLGKLLSRGTGPLTKLVDEPVAEKVARTIRAAGADAVVVAEAATQRLEPPTDRQEAPAEPAASNLPLPSAPVPEHASVDREVAGKAVATTEDNDPKHAKSSMWLVGVVVLVVVALAAVVYGVWLR